jgi:hypothetical protein
MEVFASEAEEALEAIAQAKRRSYQDCEEPRSCSKQHGRPNISQDEARTES